MESKIYVGNLSFQTAASDIEQLFNQHGTVKNVNLVSDKFTGRSRGFAFVEMETQESAEQAIKALNNTEFQTRKLVVNLARPQDSQGGGGRYSKRSSRDY